MDSSNLCVINYEVAGLLQAIGDDALLIFRADLCLSHTFPTTPPPPQTLCLIKFLDINSNQCYQHAKKPKLENYLPHVKPPNSVLLLINNGL